MSSHEASTIIRALAPLTARRGEKGYKLTSREGEVSSPSRGERERVPRPGEGRDTSDGVRSDR